MIFVRKGVDKEAKRAAEKRIASNITKEIVNGSNNDKE